MGIDATRPTTRDIRNGTIRGVDVRNNTLTGAQIDESTLDTVPNAATAGSANTANLAGGAATFGGMSAHRVDPLTLSNGGSRVVGTFGPFTLTASCAINAGDTDTAAISVTTSQNNAAYIGEAEDADFDIADPPVVYVGANGTPTGTAAIDEDGPLALGPDGTDLFGHQLYAAVNTLGQVGTCRFGGVLFVG